MNRQDTIRELTRKYLKQQASTAPKPYINVGNQLSSQAWPPASQHYTLDKSDYLYILSPPNDNFSWKRMAMASAWVDFPIGDEAITGSLDGYSKSASENHAIHRPAYYVNLLVYPWRYEPDGVFLGDYYGPFDF